MFFEKKYLSKCLKHRFSHIIGWIMCIGIICFLLCYSIQIMVVKNNVKNGNIKEYVGQYTLIQSRRGGNIFYTFVLDNGDKICLSSIQNVIELQNNKQLYFRYVAPKRGIPPAYTALEITTADYTIIFLAKEKALYEINGKIIVALSMAFVMAFLIIIPKILCIVPKKKRNKKRDKGTGLLSPD